MLTWIRHMRLWRYPAAGAMVLLAARVAQLIQAKVHTGGVSMVFLTAVLICALTLGAPPAYFAALLAFTLYNYYFLEPRFTLQLITLEDYLGFAFFLGVAMLTAGLAGLLREQARRNRSIANQTGALFEASRRLSSTGNEDAIRHQLVQYIAEAALGEAMLAEGPHTWRWPADLEPAELDPGHPPLGWEVRPVRADGSELGWAAWRRRPERRPDPAAERLISVLIDLGAAAILRARLSARQADLAAAAKTEQLRTALLSSISHDLRTPIAVILASATSLKAFGAKFPPGVREDLITTIEEEAERLNLFVVNLLSMTKLESGALTLERQVFDAAEVVNRAAERVEKARRRIVRRTNVDGLVVEGDPILLEQALSNVIENAARYSPAEAAIGIRGTRRGGEVVLEVEDQGPGVPEEDLDRIFEKFYRSRPSSGASQGTGLGLSISKGLLEAMNGSISARNGPPGRGGFVVTLSLQASQRG